MAWTYCCWYHRDMWRDLHNNLRLAAPTCKWPWARGVLSLLRSQVIVLTKWILRAPLTLGGSGLTGHSTKGVDAMWIICLKTYICLFFLNMLKSTLMASYLHASSFSFPFQYLYIFENTHLLNWIIWLADHLPQTISSDKTYYYLD